MLTRSIVLLFVVAGAPDGGVRPPRGAWRDEARRQAAQALEQCRTDHPTCKAPWVDFLAPLQPCANRGAVCPPELMNRETTGGTWMCGCDDCAKDTDCGKGERCGIVVDPCQRNARRQKRTCVSADAGTTLQQLTPCMNLPPIAPEAGSPMR